MTVPDNLAELPAYLVHDLICRVLFEPGELVDGRPPANAIAVEGIMTGFYFHPGRLEEARPKVEAIIRDVVREEFLKGKGGGYSFLELCVDRHGGQWAEHPTMEALLVLAMGLGLGGYCLPRTYWTSLPGGMPYVWFDRGAT